MQLKSKLMRLFNSSIGIASGSIHKPYFDNDLMTNLSVVMLYRIRDHRKGLIVTNGLAYYVF